MSASYAQFRSASAPAPMQTKTLSSNEVEQGNILWLPPYEETVMSLHKRGNLSGHPVFNLTKQYYPEKKFYKHPILVISRSEQTPYTIQFLLLTTFKGKDLTQRHPGREGRLEWPHYLAISPTASHPLHGKGNPTYRPLCLEHGASMDRAGYAKISEVYQMDWRDAQAYWLRNRHTQGISRFDARSLQLVLAETARWAGYIPAQQYSIRPPAVVNPASYTPRPLADVISRTSNDIVAPAIRDRITGINPTPLPVSTTVKYPRSHSVPGGLHVRSSEREPLLPTHRSVRTTPSDGGHSDPSVWRRVCVRLIKLSAILALLAGIGWLIFW